MERYSAVVKLPSHVWAAGGGGRAGEWGFLGSLLLIVNVFAREYVAEVPRLRMSRLVCARGALVEVCTRGYGVYASA